MRVLVAVSLVLGGCMVDVPVPGFSKPRTQKQAQRAAAANIEPRTLIVPEGEPPPVRPMKVRVWADTDFRGSPRWRAHIEEWVGRASSYTELSFGVRFELDIRSWDHSGDDSLTRVLERLEQDDPGADVDLVVGFVRAPSGASNDYHRLGLARPLGKHFVLRDMNDADESHALDSVFSRLDESERAALYVVRKKHKELLGFLHEWAHVMGLPHEPEDGRVMATGYSHLAATFSPAGARLVRLGVRARRGEATTPEMRELLATNGDWPTDERNDVLQGLGGGTVMPPTSPAAATTGGAVSPEVPDVEDELQKDLYAGALTRAEGRLGSLTNPALEVQVKAEILRQRREMGLPADRVKSGVAPDDEPALRATFVLVMKQLGEGKYGPARRGVAAAGKQFPRALPMVVLTCCLEGYAGNAANARKACAAAVARWDEIPFAHFWLGQVASDARQRIAHHRRVIELDPQVEGSWQALAQLYEQQKDRTAMNELRAAYQVKFHHSLPH